MGKGWTLEVHHCYAEGDHGVINCNGDRREI